MFGSDKMLFHTFDSQRERRSYGGSSFIEIQFCKFPVGTSIRKLVAVNRIKNWDNGSLYINDEKTFEKEYSRIFDYGTYNNLECGAVDIYGINYYAPFQIDSIIGKIRKYKPTDFETLETWLIESKKYNGFYILGL